MGAPSMGHAAKIVMGDESDGIIDEGLEFISETLTEEIEFIGGQGISGEREMIEERIVEGLKDISGSIIFEPTPEEIDVMLPRILGGAKTVDDIDIAATLPEFIIEIDKVGEQFRFNNCKVASATFRMSQGEVWQVELAIIAKTITTIGSITVVPIVQANPYVFTESIFTFDSSSREINEIEFVVDNGLLDDIYRNSQTRTEIPEGMVGVTVNPVLPFTADELALFTKGVVGAAADVKLTKGGKSLTFEFGNVKFNGAGPQVGERDGEILYSPTGTSYKTSSAASIKAISDITP